MTVSFFLAGYLFGGLTFIPLLLTAVLVPLWLRLPQHETSTNDQNSVLNSGDESEHEKLLSVQQEKYSPNEAAAGTFAVLRRYDFPAASAALSARSGAGNANGAAGATDGAVEAASGSESVYQSMYRSVFDRGKSAAASNSLQTEEEMAGAASGKAKRKTVPANMFYIVLRHGHLMLYDSAAQMEVRQVISLAHHAVGLSEGNDSDLYGSELTDADLFIKRTAIVLTPSEAHNASLQSPPKPFYLFASNCSDKEDFYHALVFARPAPQIPRAFHPHDAIKLQSLLHSSALSPESRALNALLSRIFLALHRTTRLRAAVQQKIEKKMARVPKPAFIAALSVHSIDLGDAAPIFSNLRLKDLNISGDTFIACDVRYTGGIKVTLAAQAKLDLGPRFKVRTVDLLLSSALQRLSGHMLIRVKPPPSNRIWFCFDGMPEMEIKVEPVVSSRQITYQFILRAIEERVRAVVAETLVKPNWDDISFFDTRGEPVRGGLWADADEETEADQEAEAEAKVALGEKNDRTRSVPALPLENADSSATSSGSEFTPQNLASAATFPNNGTAEVKRRPVAAPPPSSKVSSPVHETSKPLRSPSFTNPSPSSPSVALDESSANVELRAAGTPVQNRKWRRTPAPPPQAVDAIRQVHDRWSGEGEQSPQTPDAAGPEHTTPTVPTTPASTNSNTPLPPPPKRTPSNISASTTSASTTSTTQTRQPPSPSSASSLHSGDSQPTSQRKTFLAATQAATTAARNWSWNALAAQRRGATSPNTSAASAAASQAPASSHPQEPMGRGQPLPPPGTPLPRPQGAARGTGLFGGVGGGVKRKPVLPPRRGRGESGSSVALAEGGDAGQATSAVEGDGFGAWVENDGAEALGEAEVAGKEGGEVRRVAPPPLPSRPPPAAKPTLEGRRRSSGQRTLGEEGRVVGARRESETSIWTAGSRSGGAEGSLAEEGEEVRTRGSERGSGSVGGKGGDEGVFDDDGLLAIPAPVDDEVSDVEELGEVKGSAKGGEDSTASSTPPMEENGVDSLK